MRSLNFQKEQPATVKMNMRSTKLHAQCINTQLIHMQ